MFPVRQIFPENRVWFQQKIHALVQQQVLLQLFHDEIYNPSFQQLLHFYLLYPESHPAVSKEYLLRCEIFGNCLLSFPQNERI